MSTYDDWKLASPDDYADRHEEEGSQVRELQDEINRMEREISAYRETLEECLDWFKERYDGETFADGTRQGNDEMKLGTMVEETLKRKFK